jgi:hypothetical protein
MATHKTGTRQEWLAERLKLLEAEKELTRRSDELAHRLSTQHSDTQLNYQPGGLNCLSDRVPAFTNDSMKAFCTGLPGSM